MLKAPRSRRTGDLIRGLAVDLSPLRQSRDFRVLWIGELVSMVGRQITVVALPFQVFVLTHSSFAVGLIGLAQLIPLVLFTIAGGAVADRVDRRSLILVTEAGMAGSTVLLLLGAIHGHPSLWYLYTATGLQAGISGINWPARSAAVPNLVSRDRLPAALALNQIMFNGSMVVGPALAGLLLSRFGLRWAYAADVASCVAAIGAAWLLRPLPPKREETTRVSGWADIREGFAYLRGRRVLLGTFLIDLDAMIFGMPRALFPVLALTVFHVGPSGLGLLYAAPAIGALLGALTTGWVGRVSRQGLAVIWAVALWGAAITAFGLSGRLFALALLFLAIAGAADVISAVFRGTILQLSVPDSLRGRVSAVHIMVVTGGPRLGDVEAGWVAALVSPWFSVVSGGAVCVIGALLLAAAIPELARYR
ncbi:MAG TPA: MFS transporter, partial [Actinomycetota bacterium]|nr:MFS transporter [Actinomycetota bacterium]